MKEKDVARSYAYALIELGEAQKVDAAEELTKLTEVINRSNDLENLLFLTVFTDEEKTAVLDQVMSKLNLSKVVKNFVQFLLQEGRINLFPLIYKEVIVIDDHRRGFIRGTIEGSLDSVDPSFQEKIKAYLKQQLKNEPKLNYVKNEELAAGYRVTVGDLQLDASLENQLNRFKKSILNL